MTPSVSRLGSFTRHILSAVPTLATCMAVCACGADADLPPVGPASRPRQGSPLTEAEAPPDVVMPPSGQDYDTNCDAMATEEAPILPVAPGESAYFDQPVPRRLHQIWYGPPHPLFGPRMQSWRTYAEIFGYDYKLWGDNDDDILALIMPVKNYQVLHFYREVGDYRAVSDVVRLSLLSLFGGIYLDSDLQPPSDEHGVFDLDEWLPMTNVAAIAEAEVRETDSTSVFWTNCLLMSSVHHPLIEHLARTLPDNHAHWQSRFGTIAEYTSGPFFLTRSVAGAITTLAFEEACAFHLFGGGDVGPFAWGLPPDAAALDENQR